MLRLEEFEHPQTYRFRKDYFRLHFYSFDISNYDRIFRIIISTPIITAPPFSRCLNYYTTPGMFENLDLASHYHHFKIFVLACIGPRSSAFLFSLLTLVLIAIRLSGSWFFPLNFPISMLFSFLSFSLDFYSKPHFNRDLLPLLDTHIHPLRN